MVTCWVLQQGRGHNKLLDAAHGRLMLRTPDKITCFLCERPETSCYGCHIRNETTQELDHPKECLEIFKAGQGVHRQYGIDIPWIRLKTFSTYDMTKEGNLGAPGFAFIQIEVKTSLASMLKNGTKVSS